MIIILADWKCHSVHNAPHALFCMKFCLWPRWISSNCERDSKTTLPIARAERKKREKITELQQHRLYDFMTIISLMCFFFCCFQPVANNKIDSCVYEMITVHRHVANYKLINNRISLSDTVNNKFKRTFFTQTHTRDWNCRPAYQWNGEWEKQRENQQRQHHRQQLQLQQFKLPRACA